MKTIITTTVTIIAIIIITTMMFVRSMILIDKFPNDGWWHWHKFMYVFPHDHVNSMNCIRAREMDWFGKSKRLADFYWIHLFEGCRAGCDLLTSTDTIRNLFSPESPICLLCFKVILNCSWPTLCKISKWASFSGHFLKTPMILHRGLW